MTHILALLIVFTTAIATAATVFPATAAELNGPISVTGDDLDILEVQGDAGGSSRFRGRILDITGKGVLFQIGDGVPRVFPHQRVLSVAAQYPDVFQQAKRLFEKGDIQGSLTLWPVAWKAESRLWARREISSYIVRCYHALGQYGEAARQFLAADFASDADSPYWACIPLLWFPESAGVPAEAEIVAWLQGNRPEQQLLAGSFLLDSSRRTLAVATLSRLQMGSVPHVAELAQWQLRRREILTADAATLGQWEKQAEALAASLRSGPCYLIGMGWKARGDREKAAIWLLKPPLLWPENRRLAARCLWEAAQILEQAEQPDRSGLPTASAKLYRELAERFPEAPWAAQSRTTQAAQPPNSQ